MKQVGGIKYISRKFRTWLERFGIVLFALFAIVLIVLEKMDSPIIGSMRVAFLEVMLPVTNTLAVPVRWVSKRVDIVSEYFSLVDENEKLLLENQKLKQERENILFLIQENQQLAKMLNYKYPPAVNSVTAKIVADSESAFAQSLIVLAGSNSGVEKGDVVMANGALMGRVINVASDAAQVLLLNDVNSRIPVFVGKDRQRAILVGDNTNAPVLILFLQKDKIAVGDEITTSGDAGVFPSGLIIGTVDEVGDDDAKVILAVDRDKVDYVKILNFGQRGILQSTDKWTK